MFGRREGDMAPYGHPCVCHWQLTADCGCTLVASLTICHRVWVIDSLYCISNPYQLALITVGWPDELNCPETSCSFNILLAQRNVSLWFHQNTIQKNNNKKNKQFSYFSGDKVNQNCVA